MKSFILDRFAELPGWFENTCFELIRKQPDGRWILFISYLGSNKERQTEYYQNQRGEIREFATLDSALTLLLKYRPVVDVSIHDQTKERLAQDNVKDK